MPYFRMRSSTPARIRSPRRRKRGDHRLALQLVSVAFAAASDSVSPPMVKEKKISSISFITSPRPTTADSG